MLMYRAKRLARHSYAVPWCVPQWGWREFWASAAGSVALGSSSGVAFATSARQMVGAAYGIPVGKGRMAIELGLRGLGIGPGDDVVMPSYVCASVLHAVQRIGAQPAFADIGGDLNVTVETVAAAITPRTRCVIVPHLFGAAAPIAAIVRALDGTGIAVLDDAAQALGATDNGRLVGGFGACGVISCGPGKPLAGSGGGVLVTNDRELFERASAIALRVGDARAARRRVWSHWVWRRARRVTLPVQVMLNRLYDAPEQCGETEYELEAMPELEARICLMQLRRLAETTAIRRRNASVILAAMGPLSRYSVVPWGPGSAAMKLALVLPQDGPTAEEVIDAFTDGGVECQRGYSPCHYAIEASNARVQVTEATWRCVVCIPLETRLNNSGRLVASLRELNDRVAAKKAAQSCDASIASISLDASKPETSPGRQRSYPGH